MLREKVKGLTQMAEYTVENIPGSPKEYWDYLNEVAPAENEDFSE